MSSLDRDIWIYRDPRSGSTGFSKYMSSVLNRRFYCADYHTHTIDDNGSVLWRGTPSVELMLNTHYTSTLENLPLYKNPFIFRCLRKNLCEQFLSLQLMGHVGSGFHNFEKFTDSPNTAGFYNFIETTKLTVSMLEVYHFLKFKKQEHTNWKKYTSGYETYTIFYEDINTPFDIPSLNLYNVNVDSHTEKLPDYKRKVFLNYDEVNQWINSFATAFELDNNQI